MTEGQEREALIEIADQARHALLTQDKAPQALNAKWVLDRCRAALAAREEPPTHFEWPEHYEVGETQTTACEIPLDGRSHTSYRKEVSCVACLQTMLAATREDTERPSIIPGDHPETRKLAAMMREDTERPEGSNAAAERVVAETVAGALGIPTDSPSAVELAARAVAALGAHGKRFLLVRTDDQVLVCDAEEWGSVGMPIGHQVEAIAVSEPTPTTNTM